MKTKDQQLLEEAYGKVRYAKGPQPVKGNYIFFKDGGEVYSLNPYELKHQGIKDLNELDELYPEAAGKGMVKVAVGEDMNEFPNYSVTPDKWYEVEDSFPADHSQEAIVW
jgi:hypothetical protein